MKKIISMLLCVVMLLGASALCLTSCKKDEEGIPVTWHLNEMKHPHIFIVYGY